MPEIGAAAQLPALRLKRNEDRRLHAGHLWVFSNEVDTQQTPLTKFEAGELVRVLAHNDRALGLAYVNPQSLISARLLETWRLPDTAWFAARIRGGLTLRERLYAQPYYRVVHGEADGLPGLVIDRYGAQSVVQIGTAGMERLKPQIQEAVLQVLKCETLLFKNDGAARSLEGLPAYVEVAKGNLGDEATVIEGGLRFSVPLGEGQKTGWFFDQAANRAALTKYVRKNARVLDVFSYVGAWGMRAARDGAAAVLCVDSSASALELAAKNADRNSLQIGTRKGDAFEVLEALANEGGQIRYRHPRSARIRQTQEGCTQSAGGLQAVESACDPASGQRRDSGFLLMLLSRERRGVAGGHRQGRTRRGQAAAASGNGRPGTGSSRCIPPSRKPGISKPISAA